MDRYLRFDQRRRFDAAALAKVVQRESRPLPGMHRRAPLQVGQREGGLAVAAIERAQQREQRRVLGDRHELSVAPRPTRGCEVEAKNPNFSDEGVGHRLPLSWGREEPEQRDDEVDAQVRLKVGMRLAATNGTDGRYVQVRRRYTGSVRKNRDDVACPEQIPLR